MRSNRKFRLAVFYAIAIATPVALAIGWTAFDPLLQGVPGYLALVVVALIARFLGFYPAIAATSSFAAVLWFHVLPIVFAGRPLPFLLIRLLLFVIAAAVVASLSRQTDETERRMTALFETSIDAILWVDSNGRYVDANPAASSLLGYTREEILTKHVSAFTPPQHQEAISEVWHDVRSRGGRRGEFTILRKDGETREIEYVAVANVLPGFHCAIMHDITGRKDAQRAVQRLSAQLLHLQDEERRRIARQLHDTTAQNLTALRLNLVRIQRVLVAPDPAVRESLDESIALTGQSISEIRTLSYLLHPPMIEEAGLLASLRWYAKGFEERTGIRMMLDFPEELRRLPPDLETALFRIVQEALSNIQRHSGSAVASIRLERRPEAVELQIGDEGRGMPPHLREDVLLFAASGVGIAGIRERVRDLGGRLSIQSRENGTVVSVTLPLPEN
jgi:two-component system NarL family sensor kinase